MKRILNWLAVNTGWIDMKRMRERIYYCGDWKDGADMGGLPEPWYPSVGEYSNNRQDVEDLVSLMENLRPTHRNGTYYACEVGSLVWKRALARRLLAGMGVRP